MTGITKISIKHPTTAHLNLFLRGHTELHELSAELQPIQLRTHLQTWGKSQEGEEGGEAPAELRKADDLLHLVHSAEPWV